MAGVSTACLLLGCSLLCLVAPGLGTPLDDYVNKPDPSYEFREMGYEVRMDNYTVYYINMTSQTWLSSDIVSCSVWWHLLVITIPDQVDFKDTAFIYVTGGDNGNDIPKVTDEDVLFSSVVSFSSNVIAATLFQIPNQPCYFSEDVLNKRRTEDAIIAFTWGHFLHNPDKPEYLLRLPMTKAVVRAMDTIATFAQGKDPSFDITKFGVAGASKRGWTTWTTGAVVDKRTIAIVPIVEDALNLQKNLHHMWRAYGGWTFAFDDYMDQNITGYVDDQNMTMMCDIIDPYAYRDRLTMPKLVINAGGDEFFLPDDNHYFWDDMIEPKYLRMVPNAEHSLANRVLTVVLGIRAFLLSVMLDVPRPKMTWILGESSITMTADATPTEVKVFHATTLLSNRRDFRLLVLGANGKPTPQPVLWYGDLLEPSANGSYVATMELPETGWTAFFIQAFFPGPRESLLEFTTQVNIIPQTFPFLPCSGKGCTGKLV